MNIQFFLESLTPQATKHISTTINTTSQESYKKLKKLFLDQTIELKSFEDTVLDITNFNWSSINRDRNWWWQAHALPFLNWYIDSYSLQNKEERTKYFSLCIAAIDNWNVKIKKYESPLAWHDHGTAFRIRNIVNWITFCYMQGIEVISLSDNINLSKLIIEHIEWLLDSKNYSQYTNHGFDQAMILLTVSIMFDTDELEIQRFVSRQRLEEEIKFAFTDEGVHKENSPGYQKFMLGRLKQLRSLKSLGEQIISNLAESYIEKAEEFLKAITLPDGYLPMIGDTKGFEVGILDNSTNEENHKIFDYSKSGYFIVKGNSANIGHYYLLMKNCHDSNYHRHDDDLMLYLWCNGETILGDGGLYSHDESSKIRKFIRSNLAHSVPFSSGIVERDKNKLKKMPILSFDQKVGLIIGESYTSGFKIKRIVDITEIDQGILKIYDEVPNLPLFINYYFGENSNIKVIKNNKLLVSVDKVFCEIEFSSMRSVNFYRGDNDDARESSLMSKKYGENIDNMRILLSSSKNLSETKISLSVR